MITTYLHFMRESKKYERPFFPRKSWDKPCPLKYEVINHCFLHFL